MAQFSTLRRALLDEDMGVSRRAQRCRLARDAQAAIPFRSRNPEDLDTLPHPAAESSADQQPTLDRIWKLIQQLKPLDRQVIISYLEDMDAASIAEITGLSPQNVATRIHRIKNLLAKQYQKGIAR
ncbi:MAG TPA: sigma-70 family RNA polymerase sigma factor [Terracidiphilus sp.]|nr:sigma-70 family RNA polymerase sigma factor [Terracidiphilus sp.]